MTQKMTIRHMKKKKKLKKEIRFKNVKNVWKSITKAIC